MTLRPAIHQCAVLACLVGLPREASSQGIAIELAPATPTHVARAQDGVAQSVAALREGKIGDAENAVLGALEAWRPGEISADEVLAQVHAVASAYVGWAKAAGLVSAQQRAVDLCSMVVRAKPPTEPIGDPEVECMRMISEAVGDDTKDTEALLSLFQALLDRPASDVRQAKLLNERALAIAGRGQTQRAVEELQRAAELLKSYPAEVPTRAEVLARLGTLLCESRLTAFRGRKSLQESIDLLAEAKDPDSRRFRALTSYQLAAVSFEGEAPASQRRAIFESTLGQVAALKHDHLLTETLEVAEPSVRAMAALSRSQEPGQLQQSASECAPLTKNGTLLKRLPELVAKCDFIVGEAARVAGKSEVARRHFVATAKVAAPVAGAGAAHIQMVAWIRLAQMALAEDRIDECITTLRDAGVAWRSRIGESMHDAVSYDRAADFELLSGWPQVALALALHEKVVTRPAAGQLATEALLASASTFSALSAHSRLSVEATDALIELNHARSTLSALVSSGTEFSEVARAAERARLSEIHFQALAAASEVTFGDPSSLMAELEPHELLFNYVIYRPYDVRSETSGSERYALVTLDPQDDSIRLKDVGPVTSIDTDIERFHRALRTQRLTGWDAAALGAIGRTLYERIIAPGLPPNRVPSRIYGNRSAPVLSA